MPDLIPGNSSTTYTLVVGSATSDTIDYIGDTDWWKVNLQVGYRYQVWIEGLAEGKGTLPDPYLGVYNGNGTFSFGNDNASSASLFSYAYVTPSSSGYLFLSAEASGNKTTGTYTITIWQDELASTATAASLAVNSLSGVGHIGWQGDVSDWYKVTLVAGVQYEFDLIGSDGDGTAAGLTLADPYLVLRDSIGNSLTNNNDSGLTHNARIFYTPTTTGTYYLDAQEFGNDATGTYRLIVNSSPTAAATTLGTPLAGTISFAGEINLYSVSLTAGITYAFAVDGTGLFDPYMEVLDSSGSTVRSDDDSGTGLSSFLTFTPTTSGTYFLAARESGNNATGNYSATVWQLPNVSIANASVMEANTGSTNIVFTLTLSNPSPIAVTVSAGTSGTSTATYSSDYIPANSTITFQPGQTTATFTVQVLGDNLFEPTESFHVLLSNPSNALLGDVDASGFIIDNDNPYKLPTDPYVRYQWYLYPNTGINVFPVWNEFTGAGVKVAIFDQGIDPAHPDLDGNLLTALGRNASNLSIGGSPVLSTDNHGTMVAGVIAAERNGDGIVGVAYETNLVSVYSPLTFGALTSQLSNAYSYASNFDVLNDSWGFANGFSNGTTWSFYDNFLNPTYSAAGTALANLAANGRHGLGTVVVQSAGNSFSVGDDTNLHNFQNSQYIITVAATDYGGNVTSYSSPGASVLIAAPGGGGTDTFSDIITTDRVGAAGKNSSNYTPTTGTSFSAPIVSGIVALMLEANPNLGYRDVQEILAYSAREISDANNDWRYNGAGNWNGGGLHYDAIEHNLGYGLVDALAAVRLAETWSTTSHTAANKQQITTTHTPALVISDNSNTGVHDSILVSQPISVERVEVTLNVTHPFIGDLSVLLTSPSGTTSFLLWRPQQNPLSAFGTNQDNIHFTFDTVLDWGESSVGSWLLGIYDHASGDVGTFDSWTLNLIGKSASTDNTYIYTDEFAKAVFDQPSRSTLSDSSGIDTLTAAACTSNVTLNLLPGTVSTIAGKSLNISVGTVIENAYGGDGNDVITGNNADNVLYGMRGNDTLIGGSGLDTAAWKHAAANYQLSMSNGTWKVSDKTGVDGVDSLMSIERLQFSDRVVIMDSQSHPSYAGLPSELYQFFITAFNAAPGVTYMNQLAEAYSYGLSIKDIVEIFTTKAQFTSVYSPSLSHLDMATLLMNNIVKSSATDVVKSSAIKDVKDALDFGWSVGRVIYQVFGNLAHMPLTDPSWGNTTKQFNNEIAVAKYFTEVLNQSTTDLETLREVILPVTAATDVSSDAAIAQLIGVALMTGGLPT